LAGDRLITNGNEFIVAYDAKTGKELWSVPGVDSNAIHTPLLAGDLVIITAGFPKKRSYGITLSGKVVWKYEKGTAYVPTPIVYRGLLYLLTDSGILTCLDPKTGQPVYEGKRLPAPARFTASPVAFDGKLFLTSEDGDTFVVKAGPEHTVIGKNTIDEPVYSSLAIAGDSLYLRAEKHLYRIRN
ncbi:MAG: PQQ-binding-like beta-propeller repeat protein, partial [Chloroflexi bacterium]|nr:PQQ-binding-like beta-propeller repeat protein [Chloroflexota bacterium]